MYTSPDEDRSDLFLAGAVYVLGPEVIGIVLRRVPIPAGIAPLVGLVVVLATTVLVPFLLVRYRKERWRDFGFDGSFGAAGLGLVAALPVLAAFMLGRLISGASPLDTVPAVSAVRGGAYVSFLVSVVSGLATVVLAVYMTVKARTAFRSDPRYLRATMLTLGRVVAIIAAAAAVLLYLTLVLRQDAAVAGLVFLIVPVGVAGAVLIVHRALSGSVLTSRSTLITPMVVLAIGSFVLFGEATAFVEGLWRGAMLAGIGLAVGALLESRRTAWAPLGLGLGLVLLTPLL